MFRRTRPPGAAEAPPGHGPRTTDHRAGVGRLFVVATPIGNLQDTSPRALATLAEVELVLAEDTRRIRKLLNHFSIATRTRSLHDHNEARDTPTLLARLSSGASMALVSDAGTPLLADPGFRLVRACRHEGIPVLAVPGPSAVTAALAVAGIAPYPFTFAGFLPTGAASRATALAGYAHLPHTLVLFLSPHRLLAELIACAAALGDDREAALLVELTKLHERSRGVPLADMVAAAQLGAARGEHSVVGAPPPPRPEQVAGQDEARIAVEVQLARGLPLPEARRAAARELGMSRRSLYELLKRS